MPRGRCGTQLCIESPIVYGECGRARGREPLHELTSSTEQLLVVCSLSPNFT